MVQHDVLGHLVIIMIMMYIIIKIIIIVNSYNVHNVLGHLVSTIWINCLAFSYSLRHILFVC